MSFYYNLDRSDQNDKRTADRLLQIKSALKRNGLPAKDLENNLLLATWNIREFDNASYGLRSKECLHYIAEIISSFDMVAVQEIREDLTALNNVMELLGSWWKYVISDVTLGTRGNSERMAILYDARKVEFEGLAAEVVVPPIEDNRGRTLNPSNQLYRTPYVAGFKCGWFRFIISTVHILYGGSKANSEERRDEIKAIADLLADLSKQKNAFAPNIILLGDFNIFKPSDITFEALTSAGFFIPEELQKLPSNALRNKHYDQIAFLCPDLDDQENGYGKAGVYNFFNQVYTMDDIPLYIPEMGDSYYNNSRGEPRSDYWKKRYYSTYWRTFQLSDHLPMWIELITNFGDGYLEEVKNA